jgi:hypothetical protein
MPIICLSGYKKSGKDTLCNYLLNKNGGIRIALADPLKDCVAEEYGISRASLDDPKLKEAPLLNMPVEPKDDFSKMLSEFMLKEFRTENGTQPTDFYYRDDQFLGVLGRAYGAKLYWTPRALAILKGSTNRTVNPNFWTQKVFGIIEAELNKDPTRLIVVTDVRYKSEIDQFMKKFGSKVAFVRINRFKDSPSNDPSERDLDGQDFDFYVDNTGTLEQAYSQMDQILIRL